MGHETLKPNLDSLALPKGLLDEIGLTLQENQFSRRQNMLRVNLCQHCIVLQNLLKLFLQLLPVEDILVTFRDYLIHIELMLLSKVQVEIHLVLSKVIIGADHIIDVKPLVLIASRIGQGVKWVEPLHLQVGGVRYHILVFNDHIARDAQLVVQHDYLAFHQLQACVCYRTRVINQFEVSWVSVAPAVANDRSEPAKMWLTRRDVV
jgi:hypothetical protein